MTHVLRILLDIIALAAAITAILITLWAGLQWADYTREQGRMEQYWP